MSLNENGGQAGGEPRDSGDSLLPLDFQDPSAAKKKPLPLGEFMKRPDGSKANPIPLTPKKQETAQQPAEEPKKIIPLTPKKIEPVQEAQAEEPKRVIPLTPKKVEAAPQVQAPTEEPKKIIPLTPKKIEPVQEAAQPSEEPKKIIPLTPKKVEPAQETQHKVEESAAPPAEEPKRPIPLTAKRPEPPPADEIIPEAIPQPLRPAQIIEESERHAAQQAAQPPPQPRKPLPLKPVQQPTAQPQPARPSAKTFSDKELAAKQAQARVAEKLKPVQERQAVKPAAAKPAPSLGAKLQDATLGSLMQSARVASGLSIAQVENLTRIKKSYMEALETDDIDNLPPPVFVSAYVRTLCSVYSVNQSDVELILDKLKSFGAKHEVPEALIQNLEKDGQVNMAEEMRVRKALLYIVCGLVLVILMSLSTYGAWKFKQSRELANASAQVETAAPATATSKAAQPSGEAPAIASTPGFNPAAFDRFVVIQNPTMSELKVPGMPQPKTPPKKH